MSYRYRLLPTPAQQAVLRDHCGHARYVWNLAVEQHQHWHPGRTSAPGYLEQCRQLTAARAEHPWLAAGSQMVQQQALRDFARARAVFLDPGNPARRPSWRKAGRDEGFRIVGRRGRQWDVRRLSRKTGQVWVPKAGWVRFRWSRPVPAGVKSYRVTLDRAGRWHVAFAAIPEPVPAPGTGEVIGIDRGVAVSAALSTGEMLHVPGLTVHERTRLRRLERKLGRAKRGSNRRARAKLAVARLRARETDRRKDWAEKTSTRVARGFDVIRVEDLKIGTMTRSAKGTLENPGRNVTAKAGLNAGILRSGWGLLVRRLEQKAPGRVERIRPAFTSQRCSACGHVDGKSRESQARFACTACGYACHADVNAARNIAAGHAVTARGGVRDAGPVNREPQPLASLTRTLAAGIPGLQAGEDVNYVTVAFRAGHPEVSERNKSFAAIAGTGRFADGDPGRAIHPAVAPASGDLIVTKRRVSAFTGSDLEVVLRAGGIHSLVLAGIATSGVVLSALRQAADLDYRLTVLADGCLDADPEVHRVLLEKVFPRQADVVRIADWTASLATTGAGRY